MAIYSHSRLGTFQQCKQKYVDVVWGTEKKASIKEYVSIEYPEDKLELTELLKRKGLYDKYSMICYQRLSPIILKQSIDKEIISLVKEEKNYRISLSKRNDDE